MKIRWAFRLVVAGLWGWAGVVQATTWEEWLAASPDSALVQVEFHDLYPMQRTRDTDRRGNILFRNRAYIGDLFFSPVAGAILPEPPFHITIHFFAVREKELNWPEEDALMPPAFRVHPLPGLQMHPPLKTVLFPPQTNWPVRVPLEMPNATHSWRDKHSGIVPVYEVTDAKGRLLCRGMLETRQASESYTVHTFVGEDQDDKTLETIIKSSSEWEKIHALRDVPAAYSDIQNIWFTRSLWDAAKEQPLLLRRLLLLGIYFCGEDPLLPEMRETFRINKSGHLLLGGIGKKPVDSIRRAQFGQLKLYDSNPDDDRAETDEEKTQLANATPVFADKAAYQIFSVICFCVFLLGTIILLIRVFGFRRGERRVVIWVWLPAWAVFCAIAFYAAGISFLNRKPRVDVTEYRLGVGGWAEMRCQAVVQTYSFTEGRPIWHVPHGTWGSHLNADERLNGFWKRRMEQPGPLEDVYTLNREVGGGLVKNEFIWFEEIAPPLQKETRDETSVLHVQADLDGVWLLANGQWRAFGPVDAGTTLAVESGTPIERFSGLPEVIEKKFDWKIKTNKPCSHPEHAHYDPDEQPTITIPKHDWITVALQTNTPPRINVDWGTETITEGRTIWVTQWP